jgi:hypothetical protein
MQVTITDTTDTAAPVRTIPMTPMAAAAGEQFMALVGELMTQESGLSQPDAMRRVWETPTGRELWAAWGPAPADVTKALAHLSVTKASGRVTVRKTDVGSRPANQQEQTPENNHLLAMEHFLAMVKTLQEKHPSLDEQAATRMVLATRRGAELHRLWKDPQTNHAFPDPNAPTKKSLAYDALVTIAKRVQREQSGLSFEQAFDQARRLPEALPHLRDYTAPDANATAVELAKSARDGVGEVRELLAAGVATYVELIRKRCEELNPTDWVSALPTVAAQYPREVRLAREGR